MTTLAEAPAPEQDTDILPRPHPAAPSWPAPGGPPRPRRPPRRRPPSAEEYAPPGPIQVLARGILLLVSAMLFAFAANLMVLSHVQHFVAQQQLLNEYREELAAGTAPVSEGTFDGKLLRDGAPVGVLMIPVLGVREVISEGSSADVLRNGPGHRRDSVLPGQLGMSTVMGRVSAFGGPFQRIQELAPGNAFQIVTGQGTQTFQVIGVRYAGDPIPAYKRGTSRLVLVTARGTAFIPTGIAYVDAQLTSPVQPAGQRQTTALSLPSADAAMSTDTSTLWALVFALQFLLAVEVTAVWSYRRLGPQKTWIVFAPLSILAALYVSNQLTILLPNLL